MRTMGLMGTVLAAWMLAGEAAAQLYSVEVLKGGKGSGAYGLSDAVPPHVAGTFVVAPHGKCQPFCWPNSRARA